MSILVQEPDSANKFRQLFLDARNAVSETEAKSCSLALEESGLTCLVPGGAQVGDLICQFISSNVLAIIREHSQGQREVQNRGSRRELPCIVINGSLPYFRALTFLG